eukprot:1327732-Rhodomonas_salina.2
MMREMSLQVSDCWPPHIECQCQTRTSHCQRRCGPHLADGFGVVCGCDVEDSHALDALRIHERQCRCNLPVDCVAVRV